LVRIRWRSFVVSRGALHIEQLDAYVTISTTPWTHGEKDFAKVLSQTEPPNVAGVRVEREQNEHQIGNVQWQSHRKIAQLERFGSIFNRPTVHIASSGVGVKVLLVLVVYKIVVVLFVGIDYGTHLVVHLVTQQDGKHEHTEKEYRVEGHVG